VVPPERVVTTTGAIPSGPDPVAASTPQGPEPAHLRRGNRDERTPDQTEMANWRASVTATATKERRYHAGKSRPLSARAMPALDDQGDAGRGRSRDGLGREVGQVIDRVCEGRERLVVDLSGTTSIDSSGLVVLVRAHELLGGRPGVVEVHTADPDVLQVSRTSGVDNCVTLRSDPL
jgi:ABC-type transporter Mla MlaB component